MPDPRAPHRDTRILHAGQPPFLDGAAPVNAPVVRTSTVRFEGSAAFDRLKARRIAGENVSLYGRHGVSTHRALEEALCVSEGASRAWLTPSGLAAISLGLLSLLKSGEHVLITDNVYDPVRDRVVATLFRNFGIEASFFDPQTQSLRDLLRPDTRAVYAESPGSMLFEVLDLPALAAVTRQNHIALMVDNTWSAGCLHDAFAHGADLVASSLTKYAGGHSDVMQGALLARDEALARRIGAMHESLGYAVSADDAYLVLRGMRTLPVRLAQHGRNALRVAQWLEARPEVERVYCPALPSDPGHALWKRDFEGHNGLVSVQFRGFGLARMNAVVDALRLYSLGASWGGYESLAYPLASAALSRHSSWQRAGKRRADAGLAPAAGVIRLHIGLENPEDLIVDLEQAIARALALELDDAANVPGERE